MAFFWKKRDELMRTKKKIFIVDDDNIVHQAIAAVLSTDEFEIIHAL